MSATFLIRRNADSEWYFEFADSSGGLLMVSLAFAGRGELDQAIKDVRMGSMMSQFIAAGKDDHGNSFFVIKNASGQVLVKSLPFDSEMVFNNALHTVRDSACIAEVKDLTVS